MMAVAVAVAVEVEEAAAIGGGFGVSLISDPLISDCEEREGE